MSISPGMLGRRRAWALGQTTLGEPAPGDTGNRTTLGHTRHVISQGRFSPAANALSRHRGGRAGLGMLVAELPSDLETQQLLTACGLSSTLRVEDGEDIQQALRRRWLPSARVCSLSTSDAYFFQPSLVRQRAISPQNEAAALSLLLEYVQDDACAAAVKAACRELPSEGGAAGTPCSECDELVHWSSASGVVTALRPATFDGGLRGCAASRALRPGDVVAEVPATALVTATTARACRRLQPVLQTLGAVTDDVVLVLWTMLERADPRSAHRPLLRLHEGPLWSALTMPDDALSLLEGTSVHAEAQELRHAARQQFDSLFPTLCVQWPAVFCPATAFAYDDYLAAVELWQAYGMQMLLPGASSPQTALAPVCCLLNHSCTAPHVVRYSKPDHEGVYRLRTVRPCDEGCEVTLSYGGLTNAKLLMWYGFTVDQNPCDAVEFELDVPASPSCPAQEATHMLRANCALPCRLLAALRVLCADSDLRHESLLSEQQSPENEIAALSMLSELVTALESALPPAPEAADLHPSTVHCARLLKGQRNILAATAAECSRRLAVLGVVIE